MVNINYNKQIIPIDTYFLDSVSTVKNRISGIVNILPEYLYIQDEEKIFTNIQDLSDYKEDIIVHNLWEFVKNSADIVSILKFNENMDILKLWTMYWRDNPQIEFTFIELETIYGSKYDISLIYRSISEITSDSAREFIRNLEKKLRIFKKSQKKITEFFKYLASISSVPLVNMGNTSVSITREFTVDDKYSLISLFNILNTSEQIPLINFNNYYKILNHYTPPVNWLSSTEYIKLFIRYGTEYIIVKIFKGENDIFSISFDDSISDVIQQVLTSINAILKQIISETVGEYFAYQGIINNNFFSDFILTTENLPEFISINDNDIHKGEDASRNVYFTNPYLENTFVNFSITRDIIKSKNSVLPVNTEFIRIYIINKSVDTIGLFTEFIGKIINMYNLYYRDNIEDIYNMLNIKEKIARKKKVKKKDFLKDVIPTVFSSEKDKYSIKCQSKRAPKIIPYDDFRVDNERQISFPIKRDSQRYDIPVTYYECKDSVFKYPGLVKFDNIIGYAPCCYKKPQNKTNSIFRKYYYDEQVEEKKQQEYIFQSNKIVVAGGFAKFPIGDKIINDIGQYFNRVNDDISKVILRKGVYHTPNSFLNCVLLALGNSGVINKSKEETELFLREERRRLLQDENILPVVMQEMYGKSKENIEQYINNVDIYLDPLLCIRLIEKVYNCNILLFVKNDDYPNGEMVVPNHINGYYQFERDNNKPCIFIFNHIGTKKLDYPHCELIFQTVISNILQIQKGNIGQNDSYFSYIWDRNNRIYDLSWKTFDKISKNYSKNIKFAAIPENISTILSIHSQYIDENGKVRLVGLKYNGDNIIAETSPLPPLQLPLLPISKITPSGEEIIREFMGKYCNNLTEYNINGDLPQYIKGWYNDMFTIKIYIDGPQQKIIDKSVLISGLYDQNSKIARYLSNWIMYLFSKYINTNNIEQIDRNIIRDFALLYTTVDENYIYDNIEIGDIFDERSARDILRGGRIICNSYELQKRLIYQLRLVIERNRKKVANFYTKQNLESYYTSVIDFKKYSNENIIYYREGLSKDLKFLTKSYQKVNKLYNYPSRDNTPYFFTHPEITGGAVVLAQNFPSISDAIDSGVVWNEQGYNFAPSGEDITIREDKSFYIYTIDTDKNTELYQVGEDVKNNLTVIASSKNNFSSILDL